MEYAFIYLMIGLLIAATLLLRDWGGWQEATWRLLIVTVAWLPMLIVIWFFYVISPAIKVDETNEKEEVKL